MRQSARKPQFVAPELKIHEAIVEAMNVLVKPGVRFFHPPNEGERDPAYAYRLKRLGVVAGVPDLVILLPDGRCGFLEIKTEVGKLSLAQKAFRDDVVTLGHRYVVVLSVTDALRALEEWGALKSGVRP